MNVSLTAELEAFVEGAVESGRYGSASEAVREGLRLLQEREAKFLPYLGNRFVPPTLQNAG